MARKASHQTPLPALFFRFSRFSRTLRPATKKAAECRTLRDQVLMCARFRLRALALLGREP